MEDYILSEITYSVDVIKPIIDQINRIVEEADRIYLEGTNKAFDLPEFKSLEIAKNFVNVLDEKELMLDILDSGMAKDINVYIGDENDKEELKDFSVVTFKHKVGDKDLGTIGIIGPKRMDYSKVISVMKYISKKINENRRKKNKMAENEESKEEVVEQLEEKEQSKETKLKDTILLQKEQLEEQEDRLKRLMAEFDNFKKRSAKEREGLYNSLVSDIFSSLLPVIDNLEKAVAAQTQDENYKQGVELVLKQFKDVLTANGVEEIETIGQTFDPELHEAVASVTDETLGEKEIKEEYRKGYKIGSKVIRHSMVVVAN